MMTTAEANALRIENEKLRTKMELMQQLSTTAKFYNYFFKELKHHPTNKSCFDAVNLQYFQLFGIWRYSDYGSFRVQLTKFNKK